MTPTITESSAARRMLVRLGWFVGIWAASVGVLSGVAYILHKVIRG